MYLSHAIFQWPYEAEIRGFPPDSDYVINAHKIWRHAKSKLQEGNTDFDRIDCIGALKRAIDHRIKAIRKTYFIDSLPSPRGGKQVLERLKDFGLVRPTILKELMEVRNLIEHQGAAPPNLNKCLFYVDMVWYFLKSTDKIVEETLHTIVYEDNQTSSAVSIYIKLAEKWNIRVDGHIHYALLSPEQSVNALLLSKYRGGEPKDRSGLVKFSGDIEYDDAQLVRIARDYFAASGYWHEDHAD